MIEHINIQKLVINDKNPRKIVDEKLKQLEKSLKSFPEMLELRPVIVDDNYVVLGGNMRLTAARNIGLETIPVIKASNLTEKQKKEFVIKDNVSFGEWDWEFLQTEWNTEPLLEWGLDFQPADWENFDINDFFKEGEKNEDEGGSDDKKTSITLNYTSDEYDKVIEEFGSRKGTKEKIIWDLLGL